MSDFLAGEFADLSPHVLGRLALRLLVAGFVGGLLGWNRERYGKSAGLRTYVLVAVGAAGFTAVTQLAQLGNDGVTRVLQGLVAGIGFLGAGCILKADHENHVHGLTTAAGIWVAAAAGMAAGLGRSASAIVIGLFGWFTLAVLGWWEHRPRLS